MELNKLAFAAQPRTPWQVFDLTLLIVRENFFKLTKIYLATLLPITFLAIFIFSFSTASFIVWWCKPLFERPLLTYLAKQCFHQPCSTWQAVYSLKQLGISNIIKMLTIYRFSPNRAYLSPVEQLEKQKGLASITRKNLLKARIDHKQTLWMLLCVHLEMLFTFILLLIAFNFIPVGISFDSQFFQNSFDSKTAEIIYFISYLISITLIAPYFVTGGFLMYLNARINLEAWDIELTFKRIAARFSSLSVIFLLSFIIFLSPPSSYAKALDTKAEIPSENLSKIKADVDEIYRQHQLIEKQTIWTIKATEDEPKDISKWQQYIKAFFSSLAKIGPLLGYLMWFIVALLIFWLAKQLYQYRGKWFIGHNKSTIIEKPADLPTFFADATQTALPENLLQAAEQALQKQQYRQSLQYLLAFALQLAEQNSTFSCHKSMTEKECEQALLAVLPAEQHRNYQQLFLYWIQQAWAHKTVTNAQIMHLINDFKLLASEPLDA